MSNIYMKIPNVQGNATAENYKGWIEIEHFSLGVHTNVDTQVGKTVDRGNELLHISEVEMIKRLDNASNDLFNYTCSGNVLSEVEIHVCGSNKNNDAYAKYILNDVIISQHYTHVSADTRPQETISLNFTKIRRTYIGRNAKNERLSPNTVGYDLTTAKPL